FRVAVGVLLVAIVAGLTAIVERLLARVADRRQRENFGSGDFADDQSPAWIVGSRGDRNAAISTDRNTARYHESRLLLNRPPAGTEACAPLEGTIAIVGRDNSEAFIELRQRCERAAQIQRQVLIGNARQHDRIVRPD